MRAARHLRELLVIHDKVAKHIKCIGKFYLVIHVFLFETLLLILDVDRNSF